MKYYEAFDKKSKREIIDKYLDWYADNDDIMNRFMELIGSDSETTYSADGDIYLLDDLVSLEDIDEVEFEIIDVLCSARELYSEQGIIPDYILHKTNLWDYSLSEISDWLKSEGVYFTKNNVAVMIKGEEV